MAMYQVQFDINKAIEIILYIVDSGAEPTFHHISKILYFADKEHLEKFGRFINGDFYVAMKHGPVPSRTYDCLKFVRDNNYYFNAEDIEKLKNAFSVYQRYHVKNLRKPDTDCFSDSDLECLDNSIAKYGKMDFNTLTKTSHDEPWENADENDIIEIQDIISTFKNPDELIEYLKDPHPGVAC